jgi:hypothetical protein
MVKFYAEWKAENHSDQDEAMLWTLLFNWFSVGVNCLSLTFKGFNTWRLEEHLPIEVEESAPSEQFALIIDLTFTIGYGFIIYLVIYVYKLYDGFIKHLLG